MPEVDLTEVLHSGKISNGPNVEKFEQLLREYIGNPYITTTADVSSSIALCLYMAGVRPGDEVICSPMACLATTMPILNLFAKPVWADINLETGLISGKSVQERITPKAKAILLYDWAGNPVDVAEFYQLRLPTIEDANEAWGAEGRSLMVGASYLDFTVFGFSPTRHITTGEGAAIAVRNDGDFELAQYYKRYNIYQPTFRDELGEINQSSNIATPGYYTCMNEIAATIGIAQMTDMRQRLMRHQFNGMCYDSALQSIHGITIIKKIGQSAFWVYTFYAEKRDDLLRKLRECGIYASKVHSRCDAYSCFGTGKADLPGVAYFEEHALSIPCGWWVTDEDREYIIDCIKGGW